MLPAPFRKVMGGRLAQVFFEMRNGAFPGKGCGFFFIARGPAIIVEGMARAGIGMRGDVFARIFQCLYVFFGTPINAPVIFSIMEQKGSLDRSEALFGLAAIIGDGGFQA